MIDYKTIIKELKKDFSFNILDEEHLVSFVKGNETFVKYNNETNEIVFSYKDEFEINRLIFETFNQNFSKDFQISVNKQFESTSLMIDIARNNVLKVETFKKVIRYIALMGYDTLKIYLEDVFEVVNEPYFGHFRGKLSIEEIKDIVAYAKIFNIKIIPCIQTLAHLNGLLKWCVYRNNFDIDDILLVGTEQTYSLIENMFKTIDIAFDTEVVNIGMDEAAKLGRGRYLDMHGYRERLPILVEHLTKVVEIAKKHGYKCEMWGDLFFYNQEFVTNYNFKNSDKKLVENLDNDLKLIYWDYNNQDSKIFEKNILEHKKIKSEISAAGGAWKWLGYAPNNAYAMGNIRKFVEASLNQSIKEYTLTAWGDNGGETSIFAILPALNYLQTINYHNKTDKEYLFKELSTVNLKDYMYLDYLNAIRNDFKEEDLNSLSRLYLFNDPLLGIYDSCVRDEQSDIYKKVAIKLKKNINNEKFGYVFKTLYDLAKLLESKVDIGIELRSAYKEKDIERLKKLVLKLKKINKLVDKFYDSFSYQWHLESKGFGFDVQDLRIGGLKQRINYSINIIEKYIRKEIDTIEELDEDILDFHGNVNDYFKPDILVDCRYSMMSTVNCNF